MELFHTTDPKPFGMVLVEYFFFMTGACIFPLYGIYECLGPGVLLNPHCVSEYFASVFWTEMFLLCMAYGLFYYGLRQLGYSFWKRIYFLVLGTMSFVSFVWLEILLFFAWIGYHLRIPFDLDSCIVYGLSIVTPFAWLYVMVLENRLF
jgi:hypothetical protein